MFWIKSIVLPGPRLDSLSALECKEKQVLKEVSATNYLSVFIELFIEEKYNRQFQGTDTA